MSDQSQGEGWWQAADGKWYAPEQHPDHQAGVTQPTEARRAPATVAVPRVPSPPPTAPSAGTSSSNSGKIIMGVFAVAALVVVAFILFGRDSGNKKNVAATSDSVSSSSDSSSSSSANVPSAAEVQAKLLTASDIAPDFKDAQFAVDNTSPTACGQPNVGSTIPPDVDVGSTAGNTAGSAFFQEEVSLYKDAATATKAFEEGKTSVSCTQGTTGNGQPIALSAPKDVSSTLNVKEAIEVDFETADSSGQIFAIHTDTGIISFQFQAAKAVDAKTLPDALVITKKGLQKLGLT
ncbi:MAG: hypothetical protein QOC92_4002 [Acidimicrobiaceae bacterium]|jgi:hypothetical protein